MQYAFYVVDGDVQPFIFLKTINPIRHSAVPVYPSHNINITSSPNPKNRTVIYGYIRICTDTTYPRPVFYSRCCCCCASSSRASSRAAWPDHSSNMARNRAASSSC